MKTPSLDRMHVNAHLPLPKVNGTKWNPLEFNAKLSSKAILSRLDNQVTDLPLYIRTTDAPLGSTYETDVS